MADSTTTVDVFFDFICPFVYRAGLWLADVQDNLGAAVQIRWRAFPLAQVNSKEEGWAVWEQPATDPEWASKRPARSLRAFWSWLAAQQVAPDRARHYHVALLRAIHEDGVNIEDRKALRAVAQQAGLDIEAWTRALEDQSLLDTIRADYMAAREHEIFGTPTFLFPNTRPAYLKLDGLVPPNETLTYWNDLQHFVRERPLFIELKRPH